MRDPTDRKRELGQFYCALRIDAFRDLEVFKTELQEMAERVRTEPAIDPEVRKVMVPGDPQKVFYNARLTDGISLTSHEYEAVYQFLV